MLALALAAAAVGAWSAPSHACAPATAPRAPRPPRQRAPTGDTARVSRACLTPASHSSIDGWIGWGVCVEGWVMCSRRWGCRHRALRFLEILRWGCGLCKVVCPRWRAAASALRTLPCTSCIPWRPGSRRYNPSHGSLQHAAHAAHDAPKGSPSHLAPHSWTLTSPASHPPAPWLLPALQHAPHAITTSPHRAKHLIPHTHITHDRRLAGGGRTRSRKGGRPGTASAGAAVAGGGGAGGGAAHSHVDLRGLLEASGFGSDGAWGLCGSVARFKSFLAHYSCANEEELNAEVRDLYASWPCLLCWFGLGYGKGWAGVAFGR